MYFVKSDLPWKSARLKGTGSEGFIRRKAFWVILRKKSPFLPASSLISFSLLVDPRSERAVELVAPPRCGNHRSKQSVTRARPLETLRRRSELALLGQESLLWGDCQHAARTGWHWVSDHLSQPERRAGGVLARRGLQQGLEQEQPKVIRPSPASFPFVQAV